MPETTCTVLEGSSIKVVVVGGVFMETTCKLFEDLFSKVVGGVSMEETASCKTILQLCLSKDKYTEATCESFPIETTLKGFSNENIGYVQLCLPKDKYTETTCVSLPIETTLKGLSNENIGYVFIETVFDGLLVVGDVYTGKDLSSEVVGGVPTETTWSSEVVEGVSMETT